MVFKGATIPFVLMPHFVSPGQVRRVKHAVTALCRVLDRFCDAYPTDPRLRDELQLPDFEDQLIRIEPGFPRPMRICRLDAFLQGYDVKFLEFNADSPAGVGYTDILYEGLRTTIDLERVRQEFDTAYTPILPELIATLRDAYAHVRATRPDLPERPRLALVDSADSPSVPEFRIICAAAEAAGLSALHATLDEVAYDGTTLRVKDEPVHLVYRRALLEDLDQSDLVAAARDGRICLVNPFRSRVANNKKLFALFQDPRFAHLIQGDEADVIRETIPWTRILRPGRVTYGDWKIDLLPFVADNREKLVLKPASDFGGHGVSLGMETPAEEWARIIAEHGDTRGLHRAGVRPGTGGDVPDGRGRARPDALEALQHQPLRHRRPLCRLDHPYLGPSRHQRERGRRTAAQRDRAPQAPAPGRGRRRKRGARWPDAMSRSRGATTSMRTPSASPTTSTSSASSST